MATRTPELLAEVQRKIKQFKQDPSNPQLRAEVTRLIRDYMRLEPAGTQAPDLGRTTPTPQPVAQVPTPQPMATTQPGVQAPAPPQSAKERILAQIQRTDLSRAEKGKLIREYLHGGDEQGPQTPSPQPGPEFGPDVLGVQPGFHAPSPQPAPQAPAPQAPAPQPNVAAGLDEYTGGVNDIDAFLNNLSETRQGRQRQFNENLGGSTSFLNAPSHVQNYLSSRFKPLSLQYEAQAAAGQGGGAGQNFNAFLGNTPQTLSPDAWRNLYGGLSNRFSGVGSAEDVANIGNTPGTGGADALAYSFMRNRGADLFGQTVRSNLNPSLAKYADTVLGQRRAQWGAATQGSPSNQAEWLRQEQPKWNSVLGY